MAFNRIEDFADHQYDFNLQFLRYCESDRFAPKRARALFLPELEAKAAHHMFVNNYYARVAVAAAALRHVSTIPQRSRAAPSFFVTLTPVRFSCPLNYAGTVELWRIQEWVNNAMRGFDFLGVIEAAYYATPLLCFGGEKPIISWHAHLIVWNATQTQLRAVLKRVNDEEKSAVPGVPAAGKNVIKDGQTTEVTLYMLKAPTMRYLVYPMKQQVVDHDTGEISIEPTSRFRQRTGRMRPNERAHMCELLRERSFDHMIFGGGEGELMAETICDDARLALRRERAGH